MQRSVPLRGVTAGALALSLSGCVTDHGELAERPASSGGASGTGSGGATSAFDAADGGRIPVPDTGPVAPPPEGTRSLTLVHGVIDSPWIAFCLVPVHGGREAKPGLPVPAAGLEFGRSVTLEALPGGDLAADGLLPYVIAAASADVVRGLDCRDLLDRAVLLAAPDVLDASPRSNDAGNAPTDGGASRPDASRGPDTTTGMDGAIESGAPVDAAVDAADGARPDGAVPIPDVRAAALPRVPEGSFSTPRGYLLVAGGCLGGPGVTDPSEKSVCGELYSPTAPTLSETVVAMPADATAGRVTLSVLGGSPSLTQFDLSLVPASHGDAFRVASRVVPGALRPIPPYAAASVADLDVTSPDAFVELFAFGGGTPVYKATWEPTRVASGLEGFADGEAYTLIFVGPFPGFAKRRWWNDPLVTAVENR